MAWAFAGDPGGVAGCRTPRLPGPPGRGDPSGVPSGQRILGSTTRLRQYLAWPWPNLKAISGSTRTGPPRAGPARAPQQLVVPQRRTWIFATKNIFDSKRPTSAESRLIRLNAHSAFVRPAGPGARGVSLARELGEASGWQNCLYTQAQAAFGRLGSQQL